MSLTHRAGRHPRHGRSSDDHTCTRAGRPLQRAGASAHSWDGTARLLGDAELSWISTVRPDGSPHVTPLITVLHEGAVHFCTGPDERKARNLDANPAVVLTTGSNTLHGGTDVVLEGVAERVTGEDRIRGLGDAWAAKYGED